MSQVYLSPDIFICFHEGQPCVFSFANGDSFSIESRELERLVEVANGSAAVNDDIDGAFIAAGILVTTKPEPVSWGFGLSSRIFHLASQERDVDAALSARVPRAIDSDVEYVHGSSNTKRGTSTSCLQVRLPRASLVDAGGDAFSSVLAKRRTSRSFGSQSVSLHALSTLLFATFGNVAGDGLVPKEELPSEIRTWGPKRCSPSAGGIHPSEAFIFAKNVTDLAPGVYSYDGETHALTPVEGGSCEQLESGLGRSRSFVADAAIKILIVSHLDRLWRRFRHSRGYRAALLDVGHLSQTFQLAAGSLHLDVWGTHHFDDKQVAAAAGLLPDGPIPVFVLAAGVGHGASLTEQQRQRLKDKDERARWFSPASPPPKTDSAQPHSSRQYAVAENRENDARGAGLRRQLKANGHVFMQQGIEREAVIRARRAVAGILSGHGVLEPGFDPEALVVRRGLYLDRADELYGKIYAAAYRCPEIHALPHCSVLRRTVEEIYGQDAFLYPAHMLRIAFPRPSKKADAATTPAHQDYCATQGSERAITVWCPLSDYGEDAGVLAIASGRHDEGIFPVGVSERGYIETLGDFRDNVRVGSFSVGDVLAFAALIPHWATSNESNRIRVSVDFRFQPLADPLSDRALSDICPIAGVPWDQLYDSMPALPEEYRFYWRGLALKLEPYDNLFLEDQISVAIAAARHGVAAAAAILKTAIENRGAPSALQERARLALAMLERRQMAAE